MSDKEEQEESGVKKPSMKQDFDPSSSTGADGALFTVDELDIYVNKVTLETYIFHGKKIDYPNIDHLEYDPIKHTVDVYRKNGAKQDLGVKIQWLVRPYFSQSDNIHIVQTKDGNSVDGIVVPLKHKGKD